MFSNGVSEALAAIDTPLDTLFTLDLSALSAQELLGVAARCEKAHRRNTVLRHDVCLALHQRTVSEIGGAANRVLADWLRITPRRRAGGLGSPTPWSSAPP